MTTRIRPNPFAFLTLVKELEQAGVPAERSEAGSSGRPEGVRQRSNPP